MPQLIALRREVVARAPAFAAAPTARATGRGHVIASSFGDQPLGCARPAVRNWCETSVDGEAAGPRCAEIPFASVRSAPEPALA